MENLRDSHQLFLMDGKIKAEVLKTKEVGLNNKRFSKHELEWDGLNLRSSSFQEENSRTNKLLTERLLELLKMCDNQQINMHKLILHTCSDTFHQMLGFEILECLK